ncbi:MAG: hypothetical protein QM647_16605 [Asticcacaulis sp.]
MRILHETETRVRHSAHAHWAATNRMDTLNRITTIATLVGGFMVSVLAALPVLYKNFYQPHSDVLNAGLFMLGGAVSVISILQAVQRWGERSQSHFNAASAYSSLRRKLEMLRLNLPESVPQLSVILEDLRQLGETAPAVPEGLWRKAVRAARNSS